MTIIDSSVCGEKLHWMPVSTSVLCHLDKAKYSSSGKWHEIDGIVMVRLPNGCPQYTYGDRLLAEGVLE